jgi:hypothetical protein
VESSASLPDAVEVAEASLEPPPDAGSPAAPETPETGEPEKLGADRPTEHDDQIRVDRVKHERVIPGIIVADVVAAGVQRVIECGEIKESGVADDYGSSHEMFPSGRGAPESRVSYGRRAIIAPVRLGFKSKMRE